MISFQANIGFSSSRRQNGSFVRYVLFDLFSLANSKQAALGYLATRLTSACQAKQAALAHKLSTVAKVVMSACLVFGSRRRIPRQIVR
jgi:hypothetical protein